MSRTDGPDDQEGLAWVTLGLIAIAALIVFTLPPTFIAAGPLSLGEPGGSCHGIVVHDTTLQACKK